MFISPCHASYSFHIRRHTSSSPDPSLQSTTQAAAATATHVIAMHLTSRPALLLPSLPLLATAGDPPASWGGPRPSGNIIEQANTNGAPYPADSVAEYMKCSPNPYTDEAHTCDSNPITFQACTDSCSASKRTGQPARVSCNGWNKCKDSTMVTYCRCNVGYWTPENYPGQTLQEKDLKKAK